MPRGGTSGRAAARALFVAAAALAIASGPADASPDEKVSAEHASDAATTRPSGPSDSEIEAAVARAVAWLTTRQARDGNFGAESGETALCLLALRHSGVAAAEPACVRAAAALERELPDGTVYGAALGLAALLAHDRTSHAKKTARLVKDLAQSQCDNGQWSYSTGKRTPSHGDNSNTQIAVFGLAAARARGVEVPRETFERSLEYFRTTRNEDGGWGYAERQRSRSYGSMTAGGAMSVALCAAAAEPSAPVAPKERPEVLGALAWLAKGFDPASNRGAGEAFGTRRGRRGDEFWRHYWLWSLERACAAAGADRLGDRDWYADGARRLLETQRDEGSWVGPERAEVATSFALLFLRRASKAVLTPSGAAAATTPR